MVIGLVPPTVMMMTVVVTGNHFWMDGVVGSALCVVPAVLIDRLPAGSGRRLRTRPFGTATRTATGGAGEMVFLVANDHAEVSGLEPAGPRQDVGDTRVIAS
jgi:hypothetical protein